MSNDNNFESMFSAPQQAKFTILSVVRKACDAVGGDPAILLLDEAQNWSSPQWAHVDQANLALGLVVDEAHRFDLPQWNHFRTS